MAKQWAITFVLWIAALSCWGQSFTLTGRVSDEEGNAVELCTVACLKQGAMTMTSLNGSFSIILQSADSVDIRFSMVGYKTIHRILRHPKGKQTLQVTLHSDGDLDEVTITELKRQIGQTQDLDIENAQHTPSTTGNVVEEMVQSQAGVSTHSELSSQYNVRGGSFDENSVYINNVEVYRPFLVRSGQQEGLSVINADMVERVGFSTGGFEAKYGDKMSSALDIAYKRPKPFEATLSASLLGASAYMGVSNKKVAWMNGLRYKTNKNLVGSLQTKGEYEPHFIDYQTYLVFTPNQRWTIRLLGNISDNHFNFTPSDRETSFGTLENVKSFRVYFDGKEKDMFRTFFGSLDITRHITPSTSLSLIASAFNTREQETYDIQGQYWLTQTETSENLGVGSYFQHARNYLKANVASVKLLMKNKLKSHQIEAALTMKYEKIKERSVEYEMRDSAGYSIPHTGTDLLMIYNLRSNNKIDTRRTEFYLQDNYHFGNGDEGTRYTLNYGFRVSHWNYSGETILSPRLSLGVLPSWNKNFTLRFATGLYYQTPFYKELRDTITIDGSTYARLNTKSKSQRSLQFIAGADYRFNMGERPFKFSAEAYYKLLGNLVPYTVNNVQVVYYGDQTTTGHIAGLDLKLFGEFVPGTDSWLTLSVMNTGMKISGKTIPLPTDQRYAVNLFFTDYFPGTTRWKMVLKLSYADGLPFTAPHRGLQTSNYRAPAYKRADIGMSYQLIKGQEASHRASLKNVWIGVDCLNLFGINNVNSYYWVTDVTNQQYAVPNFLTGRQLNFRITAEF